MQIVTALSKLAVLLSICFLCACDDQAWNDPYPHQSVTANTIYTAFSDQPKHLDPARSYNAEEWIFISQIYEPVVEYNYLLRPYKLEPLTAEAMPTASYDARKDVSAYNIKLKRGILYQPHPAFAKNEQGEYIYHNLDKKAATKYTAIKDFKHTGTRELTAADYVNQIKRLADPKANSPIFGFLGPYIVGLEDLREQMAAAYKQTPNALCLDLRKFELEGARVIDDYNYEIKINGKYDQFIYWLEMLFFSPVPWEADKFYCQAGLEQNNINLDTYPVGTGPFYMTENNPERRMVMQRNPNFHPEYYPSVGMPEDAANGLLQNAGQKLPLVDQVMFSLERESIPYWDKFLQGYYDRSGIASTTFNSAMSQTSGNALQLSQPLLDKGIRLAVSSNLSIGYWGFNMLDGTVGGYSAKARNLRKSISLAFDIQEFIIIFLNGRAQLANSPIPPGIDGFVPSESRNAAANLQKAKQLLAAAGYPDGIDARTGKRLQIYYDVVTSGDPNQRALFGWVTKQFAKIGIDLILRPTDYNRFQDKLHNGQLQFFSFGWNLDYPDPENALFLFYGPNARVGKDGENTSNYNNPQYDALFKQFKAFGNNPKRLALIPQMLQILDEDQPWIWGYFPQDYVLSNPWYYPTKPNAVSTNTVKYAKVNTELRAKLRVERNQPISWPIWVAVLGLLILILPAFIGYYLSMRAKAKRVQ